MSTTSKVLDFAGFRTMATWFISAFRTYCNGLFVTQNATVTAQLAAQNTAVQNMITAGQTSINTSVATAQSTISAYVSTQCTMVDVGTEANVEYCAADARTEGENITLPDPVGGQTITLVWHAATMYYGGDV